MWEVMKHIYWVWQLRLLSISTESKISWVRCCVRHFYTFCLILRNWQWIYYYILNSLQVKKLRENWLAQWRRASEGQSLVTRWFLWLKFWGRRCGWNLKFRVSYNHKGKLGEFLICEWISVMNVVNTFIWILEQSHFFSVPCLYASFSMVVFWK